MKTRQCLALLAALVLATACTETAPDCKYPVPFQCRVGPTGSMLPTYRGGELVWAVPTDIRKLKERDIIVWRWEAKCLNVFHRVWKLGVAGNGEPYVITKGDANAWPDEVAVTARELRGIVQ